MSKISLIASLAALSFAAAASAQPAAPEATLIEPEAIARQYVTIGFVEVVGVEPADEHYAVTAIDPDRRTVRFHVDPRTGDFVHGADDGDI